MALCQRSASAHSWDVNTINRLAVDVIWFPSSEGFSFFRPCWSQKREGILLCRGLEKIRAFFFNPVQWVFLHKVGFFLAWYLIFLKTIRSSVTRPKQNFTHCLLVRMKAFALLSSRAEKFFPCISIINSIVAAVFLTSLAKSSNARRRGRRSHCGWLWLLQSMVILHFLYFMLVFDLHSSPGGPCYKSTNS